VRSLRHGVAIARRYLRRQLHVGALVRVDHLLSVRRQELPLLRYRQVGVVLRQRLRLDQRLRGLLGFQLSRVLAAWRRMRRG
jgi:hypothetical protein